MCCNPTTSRYDVAVYGCDVGYMRVDVDAVEGPIFYTRQRLTGVLHPGVHSILEVFDVVF